ncbi:AFL102Wp [Eremothecium gossypii ATCC 10895]|uniref:ATP-dependent RNA helicase MRH4, mitochondrial n=1 Tax=Eremothecium gossypii (strain ATCC 10895 / CBS 109.51 / FGSC 9923 / NRRL Y-1056) TaxID=284811 RepID=MRH4_EREGS|nr:AFL102Wp [Eremothecium gossypii ATCC 10895]Q755C5.1 RecName: Full=ATP-dependent RNA helicase MRH4, mitochondrial; Flags: Precursor [Eremothecium gossypii ATCC 10895]AAS53272.1 AFL102Wp [Eremothecium gossypii ATCC 10895]AEY97582.1 FAFL102Wp [Eremothecium gossypii FDAG1]
MSSVGIASASLWLRGPVKSALKGRWLSCEQMRRYGTKSAPAVRKGGHSKKARQAPSLPFVFGRHKQLTGPEFTRRTRIGNLSDKITKFEQLKLLPEVREVMMKVIASESVLNKSLDDEDCGLDDKRVAAFLGQVQPTPIQTAVIKKMAKTLMEPQLQVHMVAAETGSGKTMSYLMPLVDYLKQEEQAAGTEEGRARLGALRSLILVPTHELVEQVYMTLEKLQEPLQLKTFKLDRDTPYKDIVEAFKGRVDIMVTTPGKLRGLFKIRMLHRPDRILSQVRFAVVDEADTLMDQSWVQETYSCIKSLRDANHLVFCSASVPMEFEKAMNKLFPNLQVVASEKLHRINKHSNIKIINVALRPYNGSKMKALAQALYAIMKDGTSEGYEKRCVVFVNEADSVNSIVDTLRDKFGHDVHGLTGEHSLDDRLATIAPFMRSPPRIQDQVRPSELKKPQERRLPNSNIKVADSKDNGQRSVSSPLKVLVTTDVLSRGINFKGVKHVILYDVPAKSIDLVHRVGRTSRMNERGHVYIFVGKKGSAQAKGLNPVVKKNRPIQ